MSERNNTNQRGQLGPAWAISTGIILLAISITLLVSLFHTLKSGETWKFSDHHPGIVNREDSPASFWISAVLWGGMILMLAYFGVSILRDGIKGMRK